MKFKFEKLIIWQRTIDFAEDINLITTTYPPKEKFNLCTQSLRAVDSCFVLLTKKKGNASTLPLF